MYGRCHTGYSYVKTTVKLHDAADAKRVKSAKTKRGL
jgi:hypothetical protein